MKNLISYKNITVIVAVLCSSVMRSQQTSLFNTYNYDLMQLNVAAIGRTCLEANLNYRAQWVGINESPKLYQLNAGMALGSKNGVGLRVFQQSQGLLKVTNVTGGYAYRIKLSESSKLHFGIGASWSQNNFDAPKASVIDKSDVTLGTNQNNLRNNNFDCEAGALFLGDKLTAGLSALHLYNTNAKLEQAAYKLKQQINITLAYKFNKGHSVEVEPWLVNRLTVGGANQPEVMVNAKFMQMFTVGAGYRVNYGLLALAGAEIGKLRVAYSFDYGTGKSATGLGTSHQILIGIDLCRKKNKPDTTVAPEPPVTESKPETPPQPATVTPVQEEPVVVKETVTPTVSAPPVEEVPKPEVVTPEPKKEEIAKPAETPLIVPEDINPIATTIFFDKNSTVIDSENDAKIKQVARIINAKRGNVVVVGYASPEGEQKTNMNLAIHRAEAVKQRLINHGVKASRLSVRNGGATSSLHNQMEGNRTVRFE